MESSSLHTAIAAVRSAGIFVIKTAKNTGINSQYASYADVWEVLSPHLKAEGLSVGFLPGTTRKDADAWIQTLTMEVRHGNQTQSIPFEILFPEGNRGVNITQRQGMAHTYGKRYALIDFFHLITGDDDDAQRLGQPERVDAAPTPANNAHWSEFCHCPALGVGDAQNQRAWSVLADPSDDSGSRTLGDNAPGQLAKLWTRYPDNVGVNAWRAELCDDRAIAKGFANWDDCRKAHRSLNLPERFTDCNGSDLNNLAMALK